MIKSYLEIKLVFKQGLWRAILYFENSCVCVVWVLDTVNINYFIYYPVKLEIISVSTNNKKDMFVCFIVGDKTEKEATRRAEIERWFWWENTGTHSVKNTRL